MTLAIEIKSWLSRGCPFVEGVSLFSRSSGSARLLGQFQKYYSVTYPPESIEKRLKHKLLEYLELHEDGSEVGNLGSEMEDESIDELVMERVTTLKRVTITEKEPPVILGLREKAKKLHKRHSIVHTEMRLATEKAERLIRAAEIMEELIPSLDRIYDSIRHWESTGEVPGSEDVGSMVKEIVSKTQKVYSLRSRISKIKSLLKKPMEAERKAALEKEMLFKDEELDGLEVYLGIK